MANPPDTFADHMPVSDMASEGHGEIDEKRFTAAPEEVRSGTDALLARTFPAKND
jgi:hypothetical protein